MDITTFTILRILHIGASVFWAGASIYLAAFIFPAVNALGPEGKKFTQQLVKTNNLPMWMTVMGFITVISGSILYWEVSLHFNMNWIASIHGIILSIGVMTATIAFIMGLAINKPTADRMAQIGQLIAQAGLPPTDQQLAEITTLTTRLKTSTNIIACLIVIAILGMAAFRYIY